MGTLSDTLTRWFGPATPTELDQEQRAALIDALVFAMMADGEEAAEEYEEIMSSGAEWNGDTTLSAFVATSKERAADAMSSKENALAYCQDISRRLADDDAREKTYELAAQVVCSDGDIAPAERGLMSMFIRAFGIPEDRAVALSAQIHKKYNLF